MKPLPQVLHLVDDTTAGGVMRVLDFLRNDHDLAQSSHHRVVCVPRGRRIANLGRPDVIVSHLAISWRGLPSLACLRASHARTPLIHVEHSYTEHFMAHNVPSDARFKTLLRLAYATFDRVVCVSDGQANWMRSSRLLRHQKLSVIRSCVDLTAFRALPAPTGPARVFGAIGRLEDQKGFDTLIKAFRHCPAPGIRLHIIGEGVQELALKALAGNDPRIVFRGFQPDPVAALANVDVVLMPSRWEAYGLVAIEALAAGRRLLCHDIDGLNDHARHGAVMIDTANGAAWSRLITRETNAGKVAPQGSAVRATQQLETRFRDGWQKILHQVGV